MRFLALLVLFSLPVLATGTEAPPFTLVGDVPAVAPAPISTLHLPLWAQTMLAVLGAVVPIASIIASFLNRYVRAMQAAGEKPSPLLLALGGVTNIAALNVDKAHQQVTAIGRRDEESPP